MASYKTKILNEKCNTESGRIAYAIELLENNYHIMRDWLKETNIPLFDDVSVYRQPECWVVWKPVEMKANRCWSKIIPLYCMYDEMVRVLDAQTWHYW